MPERTASDHSMADHNELFELELTHRLHGHPLPPGIPRLGQRSIRRGQQIRRRRRLAVVAAAAAAIACVPVLGDRLPIGTVRPAPVATAPAPVPPRPVLADVGALPTGAAPRVDFIYQSVWHRADGTRRVLTDADRADGALSWVHTGDHLFVTAALSSGFGYSIDGRAYQTLPGDAESGQAVPGPDGSVLVESGDLHIYTRDGRWLRNDEYGAYRSKFTTPRAARASIWSVDERDDEQVVVRRASLDRDAETTRFEKWSKVATADQASDQVVLSENTTDDACNEIVVGTSGASRWHSCDWTFLRLSSDGRYVLARAQSGGLAVLDIASKSAVYELGLSDAVTEESFRFAADNTLTAVVHDPDEPTAEAIASCDISGSCWRSTEWAKDFHYVLVTGDR